MGTGLFHSAYAGYARGRGISEDEALARLAGAGFSLVEASVEDLDRAGAEALAGRYARAGIALETVHGFYELPDGQRPDAERAVDRIAALGAKNFLIVPGRAAAPEQKDETARRIAEELDRLCDYAARRDVAVLVENFSDPMRPYSSVADLLVLFERVPGLWYNYDSGNFAFLDEDETAVIPLLAPRIRHVHLKDLGEAIPPETPGGRRDFMTAVPGTGRIDVETALSRLEAAGYRGDMIVEENRVRSDAELADFAEGAAESVKRFRTRYPGLFR